MPIPLLFIALGAAAGATGIGKSIKGVVDTKAAKDVQESAQFVLKSAQNSMEETKEKTTNTIQALGKTKLKASANEINDFVTTYSKIKNVELTDSAGLNELKKLNITGASISEMKETALEASSVLGGGIAGVGAGVLLGWGTYGGVMALASASTGTAIAGLSGVAATNATLAWLGGGALSVGGGGMALGTVVLGGIIAGPALLIAGGIFGSKAKEKLNNAYSNFAEANKIASEIKTAETELEVIKKNAGQLDKMINRFVILLGKANEEMKEVVKRSSDWKTFNRNEKEIVIAAMKSAQIVKAVIDVPLLTENGILTKDIEGVLNNKELLSIAESN